MASTPSRRKFALTVLIVVVLSAIVIALVVFAILSGYSVPWTGFGDYTDSKGNFERGKTLWDWLELLIIPAVLAGGALLFNWTNQKTEREIVKQRRQNDLAIAADQQREIALQNYLDRIAELLIEKDLRITENDEVRRVASVRTATILRTLDAKRNGIVTRFLNDAELLGKTHTVVSLDQASLSGADLQMAWLDETRLIRADLSEANLTEARLRGAVMDSANLNGATMVGARLVRASLKHAELAGADLTNALLTDAELFGANLTGVNLTDAKLENANLTEANLTNANLNGADLTRTLLGDANLAGAKITQKQLKVVGSLHRATMPDGTKHE